MPEADGRFDALLLDAGGVLVLPDHDRIREVLEPLDLQVEPERIDPAHYAGIRAHDAPGPDRSIWRAYLEAYVERLGLPDAHREAAIRALRGAFARSTDLWMRTIPSSVAALHAFVERGVRAGIVSNAEGTVEERLRELAVCQVGAGPGAAVEVVIDSTVVGIEKPDPAIFTPALEALALAPERCLYVGDSVRNDVEGALAAGITPVLLDPEGVHDARGHRSIRSLDELHAWL